MTSDRTQRNKIASAVTIKILTFTRHIIVLCIFEAILSDAMYALRRTGARNDLIAFVTVITAESEYCLHKRKSSTYTMLFANGRKV